VSRATAPTSTGVTLRGAIQLRASPRSTPLQPLACRRAHTPPAPPPARRGRGTLPWPARVPTRSHAPGAPLGPAGHEALPRPAHLQPIRKVPEYALRGCISLPDDFPDSLLGPRHQSTAPRALRRPRRPVGPSRPASPDPCRASARCRDPARRPPRQRTGAPRRAGRCPARVAPTTTSCHACLPHVGTTSSLIHPGHQRAFPPFPRALLTCHP